MFNFTALPPLALYIHTPWCVRKCPYCDFNSHEAREGIPEKQYIDALLADLEQELPRVWGRQIISIFIGGGTPSLFSPEALHELISAVRARLPLRADAEITLEANPGTVEKEKFRGFRTAGINRLSIGIQSFNDDMLKRLGRIHNAREAIAAAEAAHAAGFENFNLDLMFALPGQTMELAIADLTQAIQLQPTHISLYQLTIEPNTAFAHHPPLLPDDDSSWEMQQHCQQFLAQQGYQHYEISAYAREGFHCRHNINYWQFGDYLGIGAGAHGKISDASTQTITRTWKVKHPRHYLETAATSLRLAGEQRLTRQDTGLEFMMNALRLTGGFPAPLFSEHTGLPITVVEKALATAEKRGLITWDIHTIRPTERGQQFLNNLLELFMPATTIPTPDA